MSNKTTRIRVLLDWDQDSKHAIIWAADKAGLFGKKGLDVEMVPPLPKSLERVHNGEVELAINYPHNILMMRKDFPNLISVGALVKTNPEGLVTLKKDGIAKPEDMKNKTIAIGWSPLGKSQIEIFLSHHNLTDQDIEIVPVARDGETRLLAGEFDVLNGVQYGIPRMEREGHASNFFPYINSGVPDSAFLVFTGQKNWVDSSTYALKQFFFCLKEGLSLVKKWGKEEWESYTDTIEIRKRDRDEEMAVWEAILPMIDDGGDLFHHDVEEIKKLQEILFSGGMLDTKYPIEEIFVNSHLS
ncbi:MAG: ABC transporter substrate-binding protein [Anaerolineales bacterium]|jgi:ABC-type nitrate/sulfonate/bicarbonate transport system substrate-binding protein|nr:ABC transporter substrate-binding protein [Anaerolineales bacterium]|tara:strand:- start:51343 stop:52242 length:900 start_codon:yes stop_codon:yes gene_type:complete